MRKRWRARRLAAALAAPLALAGMVAVAPPASAAVCRSWNGSQPADGNHAFFGVAMASPCDVWAMDDGGSPSGPRMEHWTGSSWTAVPVSPGLGPSELEGMSAASASDIWAVGSTGSATQILHYDGSSWKSAFTSPLGGDTAVLFAVDALSATDAWAVGSRTSGAFVHSVALHWDGSSWTSWPVPDPSVGSDSELTAVSVVSASDAWAVGASEVGTFVLHWDGGHWNQAPITGLSGSAVLSGVSAVSANDVWASGYDFATNQTLVMHWDGMGWIQKPTANPGGNRWNRLYAVTATSAHDVWAVGEFADASNGLRPLVLHWDGSSWAVVSVPGSGKDLYAVSAGSAGQVWVAGRNQGGAFAAPVPVVPDVTGATVDSASGTLAANGLARGAETVTHDCPAASNGLVMSTTPSAGLQEPFGQAVGLTRCDSIATVPNVLSNTDADAQRRITSVGLTVGTISMDNRCFDIAGDVISQSPSGGAQVRPGTPVNLTESSGMNNKHQPCPVIS